MQAYSEASTVLGSASRLQERLGPAGLGNSSLCHPQALSYVSVLPSHLCCVCVCVCVCVCARARSVAKPCLTLFATSKTVAHQAPLSMGFPRQECWSGLFFLPPGHLSHLWLEPVSPALQANSLLLVTLEPENFPWLLHPISCLSLSPSHWWQMPLFPNLFHSSLVLFHFPFFYYHIPSLPTPGAKPPSFHLLTQSQVPFSFITLNFPPKVQMLWAFIQASSGFSRDSS